MTGDPFRNTSGRRNVDLSQVFKNPRRQQDPSTPPVPPPIGTSDAVSYPGVTMPSSLPEVGPQPGQDDNPYTRLIAAIAGTDVGASKPKKPAWTELMR
jgi:hypothetical protein